MNKKSIILPIFFFSILISACVKKETVVLEEYDKLISYYYGKWDVEIQTRVPDSTNVLKDTTINLSIELTPDQKIKLLNTPSKLSDNTRWYYQAKPEIWIGRGVFALNSDDSIDTITNRYIWELNNEHVVLAKTENTVKLAGTPQYVTRLITMTRQ